MKKRILALIILLAATTAAVFAAYRMGVDPPLLNVAGAYASIGVGLIFARLFKVTDGLYYMGMVFIFFAAPVGSVMNLYRSFDPYDKIVHYASGLLLAALGMMIVTYMLKRYGFNERKIATMTALTLCFAFLTASAGAGIWEIFEFVSDKIAGGSMQRGMEDTLTDMIAGNLGGLTYVAGTALIGKK